MSTSSDQKVGTLLCVFSAAAYTAFNICLNDVSRHYDSAWINCVQASVSVAVFGVYLLWQAAHGRRALPPGRELAALLTIGMITQIGSVLWVWAMSVVGVAVSATVQTGIMLAASALLGRLVLGERVSWRQLAAIALITISVLFISIGAQPADQATASLLPSLRVLLAIAAAGLGGVTFAVLTVGVRKTVTGNTSPGAIVFLMSLMGVIALGPWSLFSLGLDTLLQTTPRALAIMLGAGFMNLVAFLAVTKSLQMISVVRFNVLNNGLTTALTAAIGVLAFQEPWNGTLLLGMLLAMAGILIISIKAPPA